jgi:hypothetical protein
LIFNRNCQLMGFAHFEIQNRWIYHNVCYLDFNNRYLDSVSKIRGISLRR